MKKINAAQQLDSFDIALLNIVQENNLVTTEHMAEKVGLSASACLRG